MRDRIIVALETDAGGAAELTQELSGVAEVVKVGMTLYYAEGPRMVRLMHEAGFKVFVDLKLHDIPHQVEGAAREVAKLGCAMFTVHAAGGRAMMEAAVRGARAGAQAAGVETPAVLAVTVLTSMDDVALHDIGVDAAAHEQVARLADLARISGVDGVVCSPNEAAAMRELMRSNALVVTPGVRPSWSSAGDQARIATPAAAVESGASHLVVGRPITGADDPADAFNRILQEGWPNA
ncbi:MAG: orotidine-5'-phosphate decarboxylase [Actinomycetota bacterium]|jgi:orotidine 5'-phosphate decarboxylase subfamily 1|nr:orotidine-5'-phosphate decarboxylase [Actinomycetota bacterium]